MPRPGLTDPGRRQCVARIRQRRAARVLRASDAGGLGAARHDLHGRAIGLVLSRESNNDGTSLPPGKFIASTTDYLFATYVNDGRVVKHLNISAG